MADLFPVAGAKIFIGGVHTTQLADFVAGDFSLESWVEIDGWEQMGGIGDTAALITTALINRGRDIKQKGTRNAGQMDNRFAIQRDDPGQIALLAAEPTKDNYAFKIEFDDSKGVSPTTKLFIALVMTAQEVGGDANTTQMLQGTLEINSNIVTQAAA